MRIGNCWKPSERGYITRMWDLWRLRNPASSLTSKQLVVQCSDIHNKELLSQLGIAQVQHTCPEREPEQQVRGDMSSPPPPEIGYQGPPVTSACKLNERAADLRGKIMNKTGTWNLRSQLPRPREVYFESLEDLNTALLTIPTATITRTNELVYTEATVILEMLGYTIKTKSSTPAPWKMRLKPRSRPQGEKLASSGKIQKGGELKDKTRLLGKYKGLSSPEALETAKQRLAALANRLRRYPKRKRQKR